MIESKPHQAGIAPAYSREYKKPRGECQELVETRVGAVWSVRQEGPRLVFVYKGERGKRAAMRLLCHACRASRACTTARERNREKMHRVQCQGVGRSAEYLLSSWIAIIFESGVFSEI